MDTSTLRQELSSSIWRVKMVYALDATFAVDVTIIIPNRRQRNAQVPADGGKSMTPSIYVNNMNLLQQTLSRNTLGSCNNGKWKWGSEANFQGPARCCQEYLNLPCNKY